MTRTRLILPGLLSLAFALLPGVALGSSPVTDPAEGPLVAEAGFRLQGSHGYSIAIIAFGREGASRGTIDITVSRGKEGVSYSATSTVTAQAVRADLGHLGRVDVIRRPSGAMKTVRPKCLHEDETYESGIYEGLIEFNGEEGYTHAMANAAPALPAGVVFASHGPCGQGYGEAISANEPGARLRGLSFAGGRTLSLQVTKNSQRAKTVFTASLKERDNGIRITRELSGVAPAGAFRFDPSLETAVLSPPAPFAGSASLARSKNSFSPTLTGDLALDFPGRSAVALTGSRVHVSIAHARFTRSNSSSVSIGF
jgi:hypothetical protein